MRAVITFGVIACLGVAVGGAAWWMGWRPSNAVDSRDPRQVALGQTLYQRHCADCHGKSLEGQPDWQVRKPTGELPAPPHNGSGHTWHHADEQLLAIIKHGMARFAPPDYKTDMPAFVGILTDAEIRSVLAYIQSTWPEDLRDKQARLNRR
jgi:mono/diheme cytochrome c family protein